MFSSKIKYIGCDDADMHLFESQYVTPDGMCYNSYIMMGEKVAVTDTVDPRKSEEWLDNLEKVREGRKIDYLVVHHMEPDHAGSIGAFLEKYPEATVVASAKALQYMPQFGVEPAHTMEIKEGSTLDLGGLTLAFVSAPMVHWPEVMMSYCPEEKTLFSADGFGKFGVYHADEDDWACEARRYYFNICGKYGKPVFNVLQKAAGLDIQTIAPLHGPILDGEKMAEALRLYTIWSQYQVETDGILVAHASIHGNTAKAAEKLAEMLRKRGAEKVAVADLCRDDMAEVIEDAFRMGRMVLCCATYDGDIFPPMHYFLHKLTIKAYQNRRVALVENGTWGPQAGRIMRDMLSKMTNIEIVEPMVTIKSSLKESDIPALEALADAIMK